MIGSSCQAISGPFLTISVHILLASTTAILLQVAIFCSMDTLTLYGYILHPLVLFELILYRYMTIQNGFLNIDYV